MLKRMCITLTWLGHFSSFALAFIIRFRRCTHAFRGAGAV